MKKLFPFCFLLLFQINLFAQETPCPVIWESGLMGECIGQNANLISYDLDGDGREEIIAISLANRSFSPGDFWFVLKYDPIIQDYRQDHISFINDLTYTALNILDVDNDGEVEIVLGDNRSGVVYFDRLDYTMKGSFNGDGLIIDPKQILKADVDNDGEEEIIVANEFLTLILNKDNYEVEHELYIVNNSVLAIGDVDTDPQLEMVYSNGQLIQLENGTTTEEWNFNINNTKGFLHLEDVDNDGREEIILIKEWGDLEVYDAELKTLKYSIANTHEIDAASLIDTDQNGSKEIVYGNGQWGKIYCINSATGESLWEMEHPDYGVAAIAAGDFDGDGQLEMTWTVGCATNGSDYLNITNLASRELEWQSKNIRGPYYAVDFGDLDNDGDLEIIDISHESEAGFGDGILSIHDALSKELIWQSEIKQFGEQSSSIHFNLEIADYAADGDMDIILATGNFVDGRFIVLDGDQYEIEIDTTFENSAINTFVLFEVADINQDGILDFITTDDDELFVFNSSDFSIQQRKEVYNFYPPQQLAVEDLNKDGQLEIILCHGILETFDQNLTEIWQSDNFNFFNFDIANADSDDHLEIIGCTEQNLEIIDGGSYISEELLFISPGFENSVVATNYMGDERIEFIVANEFSLEYISSDRKSILTETIGFKTMQFDGLAVADYDGDGYSNIIIGTDHMIFEPSPICYECLSFEVETDWQYDECVYGEFGSVQISPSSGTPPFSYEWSDGYDQASREGVVPGIQTITVTDANGCSAYAHVFIEGEFLQYDRAKRNLGCTGTDDARIEVFINTGKPPFSFQWSTGATSPFIENLALGTYFLTISDANCSHVDTFLIERHSFDATFSTSKACNGESIGTIILEDISPLYDPISFNWFDGTGQSYQENLPPGEYLVTVIDGLNCIDIDTLLIEDGMLEVETEVLSPSCTNDINGSAKVSVIEGTAPFTYDWNFGASYDPIFNFLPPGENQVTVLSVDGCQVTRYIDIPTARLEVSGTVLNVSCNGSADGAIQLDIISDHPPYEITWPDQSTGSGISGIPAGYYSPWIIDQYCNVFGNFEVNEPEPIQLEMTSVDDNDTNPFPEGIVKVIPTGGTPPFNYLWNTGATTEEVRNLPAGLYSVTLTDDNGCTAEASVVLDFLSTWSEADWAGTLSISPNPTDGLLQIAIAGGAANDLDLSIWNSVGQLVSRQKILRGTQLHRMDLRENIAGIYWLRFEESGGVWTERIFLERK